MTAWLPNHGVNQTLPTLSKAMQGIKELGFREFSATGYCFGGKGPLAHSRFVNDCTSIGLYSTILAQNNLVKVSTMAHPSLLTIPDDPEKLLNQSHVPVQINS